MQNDGGIQTQFWSIFFTLH